MRVIKTLFVKSSNNYKITLLQILYFSKILYSHKYCRYENLLPKIWCWIAIWFWILIPPVVAVCTLLVCIWRRPTPSKQTNFHAYRHLQNLLGFTSNAEKDNLELSASHQKYCWEQILHQLKKSNISKCQNHEYLEASLEC